MRVFIWHCLLIFFCVQVKSGSCYISGQWVASSEWNKRNLTLTLTPKPNYLLLFFIIKFVSLSWFLWVYHFYGLFTAYLLYEEVMSVRLYNMYCFHECDVFLIHLFNDRHKNQKTRLFWVLRKKETFVCAIFGKSCYVVGTISRAGQLICLVPACISAIARVSLTSLHLKAKFNKAIIVFIMGPVVH